MIDDNLTSSDIAGRLGIGIRTISRLRRNYQVLGALYVGEGAVKRSAPRILLPIEEQMVLDYLTDRPTAYLNEVV